MASRSFKPLTLLDAERELVGAAIDDADALRAICRILPPEFFRSHESAELRRLFYVVAGWLADESYDPDGNRDRLAALGIAASHCFCGPAAVTAYVEDLARAVEQHDRLWDRRVQAARAYYDRNPFHVYGEPWPKSPHRATSITEAFSR